MKYAIILAMLFWSCTPLSQSSSNYAGDAKILQFKDEVYEVQVKTVLLHPASGAVNASLAPSVAKLGDVNLVLEFDDLQSERNTYNLKIFHCNSDWTKSNLMDLNFLNDYNEFPITTYEYSVDTHLPYVHYSIRIPSLKISGNYLAVVYRGSDKEDIILSKRFIIYDNQINFESDRNLVGAGSLAARNQQLNFTINYKDLDVINPLENIKVVIRQNQRWDNIAQNIKPSFVREVEKKLEYRFFDEEHMFKGGNEFRFFDLRSLNYPGRNVDKVNKTTKPYEVYLVKDKSRAGEAYAQYKDNNGGFIIDNLDYRNNLNANYSNVNFRLAPPRGFKGDVYVTGAFNYWDISPENQMYYDSASSEYKASFLMKQGYYDYQYVVRGKNLPYYFLEGSHYETENNYEIFVYYRPFQLQADVIIGYLNIEKNQR